jgi:hypothetical protein
MTKKKGVRYQYPGVERGRYKITLKQQHLESGGDINSKKTRSTRRQLGYTRKSLLRVDTKKRQDSN